jgi:hypothetical protein
MLASKLVLKREIDIPTLLSSDDGDDRAKALEEIAIYGYTEYFEHTMELMLSDPLNTVREKALLVLQNL